jgi:uncharacterized hydrophobic protein (TIGR00271 family)
VQTIRIQCTSDLTDSVVALLTDAEAVSSVALLRGAGVEPPGDVVLADLAREVASELIDDLVELGVHHEGTIHLGSVPTWVSRKGLEAEFRAPGSSADAVVWPEVVHGAYEDSELNWSYLSFMTLATLLAAIALVLNTPILVVGAMVLGPEFGPVAALGVALIRRRYMLLRYAARTLLLGFVIAIVATSVLALVGRAAGLVDYPVTIGSDLDYIYRPDRWSLIIALLAGAAGVLALTSDRVGALSGVFISVTTVPAAGNLALGLAFADWSEVRGSAVQLVVNIVGMALAGWLTLTIQRALWSRVSLRRLLPPVRRPAGGRPT